MISFKEYLPEALDRPYSWKWNFQGSDFVTAKFQDDKDREYSVMFDGYDNEWSELFSLSGGDYENTGYRDSFKVLSTILDITYAFIKKYNPAVLSFTGDKSSGKNKLYSMMIKHFSKNLNRLGYTSDIDPSIKTSYAVFRIRKK